MPIPDKPLRRAAPIFCAGYTVWSGFRQAQLEPGNRVAVIGIGGFGHLALYAAACGYYTIAVTHSADKQKLKRRIPWRIEVVANGDELKEYGGADGLATSNSG